MNSAKLLVIIYYIYIYWTRERERLQGTTNMYIYLSTDVSSWTATHDHSKCICFLNDKLSKMVKN